MRYTWHKRMINGDVGVKNGIFIPTREKIWKRNWIREKRKKDPYNISEERLSGLMGGSGSLSSPILISKDGQLVFKPKSSSGVSFKGSTSIGIPIISSTSSGLKAKGPQIPLVEMVLTGQVPSFRFLTVSLGQLLKERFGIELLGWNRLGEFEKVFENFEGCLHLGSVTSSMDGLVGVTRLFLLGLKVTKLTTGRLVNGSSCDGIDMVIKKLDLEPKVYAMMRDFLSKSFVKRVMLNKDSPDVVGTSRYQYDFCVFSVEDFSKESGMLKDEEDEVYTTTNVETKDHQVQNPSSPAEAEDALLKAQPTFPNVGQLNELLVKSLQTEFSKILSAHDFSSSLPTELKDLPSKFNEVNEEVKGLKKQVHELEIELPGDLKEIPTKLEDFTKIVTSLTSQVAELKTLQWELPAEFLSLPVQVLSVQAKLKTLDALPGLLLNVTKALNKFAQVFDSALSKAGDQSVPLAGQADVMPAVGEKNTNPTHHLIAFVTGRA
ncbi:hypothetical protein Tco_0806674 [Tanacetum coccineum]